VTRPGPRWHEASRRVPVRDRDADEPRRGPDSVLPPREAERVRLRVRRIIEITARAGRYRKGLDAAARRLSAEEATIIADLEDRGLQVPQLRDILWGGHVIIDDPDLYRAWYFEKRSHRRISSHHRHIDKDTYPDLGMRGVLVREKLHGRTDQGTWIQLEKTPATMGGGFHLPTLNDVRHLWDFVVYRITKSNVGPWGLSKRTERRPLYLVPDVDVAVTLHPTVAASLHRTLERLEDDDDTTAVSEDLAALFPPPDRVDASAELGLALDARGGRGLFGNSEVWVTELPSRVAGRLLAEDRLHAGTTIWDEEALG
jgi:hypothetical protein